MCHVPLDIKRDCVIKARNEMNAQIIRTPFTKCCKLKFQTGLKMTVYRFIINGADSQNKSEMDNAMKIYRWTNTINISYQPIAHIIKYYHFDRFKISFSCSFKSIINNDIFYQLEIDIRIEQEILELGRVISKSVDA